MGVPKGSRWGPDRGLDRGPIGDPDWGVHVLY